MPIDNFSGIAWSVAIFGIVIGLALVMLSKFGSLLPTNSSEANESINYLISQLGTSGLVGWVGLIILVMVIVYIIALIKGAFGGSSGKQY